MKLRKWQQKVVDEFPDIIKNYRKFILKAPTGAGKTVLASEIINNFYKNKKIVVLCHRLVLLEQLEKGLSSDHKVKKLGLSESGKPFSGYDVLISTNLRSRDFLMKAIKDCDLMIIDEAHRVSPNGQAYKELLDQFDNFSKEESKILGLTASPERRTGDQKDQLGLAFDAIIDCADIEELIKENVLVAADYKSFFIHDLDLDKMDISTGDFPVEQLSNAIIKSSMIDYACEIYKEQKKEFNKPISAWFCPDVLVAEETKRKVSKYNWQVELITAKTPLKDRLDILKRHEQGDLECLISVGVLSEGWDNPNCNIIVHLRPTLSKVFWGQSVGRGLRSSQNKTKCLVIDVSSNFTTFGPVEKLKWKLWNHRKSYLEFKNRFNWISKEQYIEDRDFTFLLCEGINESGQRCSLVYKKKILSDQPCPICNSYASTDLYKDNKLDKPKNDNSLHKVFFERVPKIFSDMNQSIWQNMESSAWRDANIYEKLFLSFCLAFDFVSGELTSTENEFWNLTLQAEKKVRHFLFEREIIIPQQEEFIFSHLSDGLSRGRIIRPVQTNYGISLCGENFVKNSDDVNERKFQKALQVVERIAAMGVTNTEELPYYKIN
jgi:superfamily II DNA or RNA helicase